MKKSLLLSLLMLIFSAASLKAQYSITAYGNDVHGISPSGTISICDLNSNGLEYTLLCQPASGNYMYSWYYYSDNSTIIPIVSGNTPWVSPSLGTCPVYCDIIDPMTMLMVGQAEAVLLVSDNNFISLPQNWTQVNTTNTSCGNVLLSALGQFWQGFQWQLNGVDITGATNNTYTATQSGSYTCKMFNQCGYATSAAHQINVTASFVKPVLSAPNGAGNCTTQIVRVVAPYVAGTHYKWYDHTGGWLPSAPDTNFLDVSGLHRSIYVVQYNNCKTDTSLLFNTTATPPLPATFNLSPSGPVTACQGATVNLSATFGIYDYSWKRNGTSIANAINTSYSTTIGGTYQAIITDGCGNTKASNSVAVSFSALPNATVTPQSSTTFCNGGNVLLKANTGTGLTYQWVKGSTSIAGATSSSYSATITGYYKVIVTNANGCSKTSSNAIVTVNPKPAATITASGPLTFCAGDSVTLTANSGTGYTYQWRKNSTAIVGSTAQQYKAKLAGAYSVKVTNTYGCTKISSNTTVSIPCRMGSEEESFSVFPNPSAGDFTLQWNGSTDGQVMIYDMTGKVLLQEKMQSNTTLLIGAEWSPGVYFVLFTGDDGTTSRTRVVRTQ